jgi:hypothetical protein
MRTEYITVEYHIHTQDKSLYGFNYYIIHRIVVRGSLQTSWAKPKHRENGSGSYLPDLHLLLDLLPRGALDDSMSLNHPIRHRCCRSPSRILHLPKLFQGMG